MALWLVRAGKRGEQEEFALNNRVAVIGWDDLPDLSQVQTREELYNLLEETYPEIQRKAIISWLSQIWPFVREMQQGDLVALPSKRRPVVYFGRVKGPYVYNPNNPEGAKHTRPVEWFKEIPRDRIDRDILYSLGAFMTVCRIQRNNAEERVVRLLEGKSPEKIKNEEKKEGEGYPADLEEYALDLIRQHIARKFKGHRLAYLVEAILQAEGYFTYRSPEGPDGGVDILAGRGPLGFDEPRLAVQVKSGDAPVGGPELNQLRGAMGKLNARVGLFVSWGGFKGAAEKEKAQSFFEIRLWDANDLIQALLANYERLPDDIQAEIPLKRIWILLPGEEEG